MDTIDTCLSQLIDDGKLYASDIRGCTDEEIRALEIVCEVELPVSYRAFLRKMGRGLGDTSLGRTMAEQSMFFGEVHALTASARAMARATGSDLPKGAFVINMDVHGLGFHFLTTGEKEESPVYLCIEGEWELRNLDEFTVVAESFNQYLVSYFKSWIDR